MIATTESYFDADREALYQGYLHALQTGGLVVQICESCSTQHFPPVVRCAACGGRSHGWIAHRAGRVVASTHAEGAAIAAVLVQVDGARLLAVADPAAPLPPGALVERVDVRSDDRSPRVAAVADLEQREPG